MKQKERDKITEEIKLIDIAYSNELNAIIWFTDKGLFYDFDFKPYVIIPFLNVLEIKEKLSKYIDIEKYRKILNPRVIGE